MSEEYPLFPELPEAGKEEAQNLINKFQEELKKVADETISHLYTDVVHHIESDSWTNYRNDMMAGFRNYNNRMVQGEHDFGKIRRAIFDEFRDEIIGDLNQDLVKEVEQLKETIEIMRRHRY